MKLSPEPTLTIPSWIVMLEQCDITTICSCLVWILALRFKKSNSILRARIHTRHGLTREIKIRDSIRQAWVLSVIEYATLIDKIAKELKTKKNKIGLQTKQRTQLNTLLWTDDMCMSSYTTILGAVSIRKTVLPGVAIPMLKILT